jgi:alkyl hydroperoxide reductase subunit AhpC
MSLRINDTAPNFRAKTTKGESLFPRVEQEDA